MDYILFRAINDVAGTSPLFDAVGIFFAEMAIFILVLIVVAIKGKGHRIRLILESALASGLALGINFVIGLLSFRYRPFMVHEQVHLLIEKSGLEKSFPSDHTAIAFALATILFLHNRRWGIVAYVIALLIGVGRIYVGVHYPTDILGGIVVGLLSGVAVYFIGRRLIAH